jgi:outer membrane protein
MLHFFNNTLAHKYLLTGVNIQIYKRYLLFVFFIASHSLYAQTKQITIVKDNNSPFLQDLETQLKKELNRITFTRFKIDYISLSGENDTFQIQQHLNTIYTNNNVDLVIALGIKSSDAMNNRATYPIISMATMVAGEIAQNKLNTANYIPLGITHSMQESVAYFAKLYAMKRIGILTEEGILKDKLTTLKNENKTLHLEVISYKDNEINEGIEGIVLLPQTTYSDEQVQQFINQANERAIPTFSLYNRYLNLGCTGAIDNMTTSILRRTALRVLHVFEGQDITELLIEPYKHSFNLILNMEGIRVIKKLPEWEYFESATLINVSKNNSKDELTLEKAIALGLQEKLSLKKSVIEVEKTAEDIKQARGKLTPNLSFGAQSTWLSNNLVEASIGQKGEMTISGSLNLQQVLFSESVLANIAIKKLLHESTMEKNKQEILDAVVAITNGYISVLLNRSNLMLQNENLNKIKLNLTISQNKEALGVQKQSDVNRWISELNLSKIEWNLAQTNYKQALYALNEALNQPISKTYTFPDSTDIETVLSFPTTLFSTYLKNEFLIEPLINFYLTEAKSNAPEIHQLLLSQQILDRKRKSAKRQLFLPELIGFANANDIFLLDGELSNPSLPAPPPPEDITWNAGIGIRIPILTNRVRKTNLQKAKLDQELLSFSKQVLSNGIEKNIRSQIQQLKSSFLSYDYAKEARNAAFENYLQSENSYQKGFITIDQLLQAQALQFNSNLLVAQNYYMMALNYMVLERLTGTIQILKSEEEQKEYFARLQDHLINTK